MYNLEQLYIEQLRNVYGIETQQITIMDSLISSVSSRPLRRLYEDHLDETKLQLERLNYLVEAKGVELNVILPLTIRSLIGMVENIIGNNATVPVKDCTIISAMQKIEHYEIVSYGTLGAYAKQLAYDDHYSLLQKSLGEEINIVSQITDLAEKIFLGETVSAKRSSVNFLSI